MTDPAERLRAHMKAHICSALDAILDAELASAPHASAEEES